MHYGHLCTVASLQHGRGVPLPVWGHGQDGEAGNFKLDKFLKRTSLGKKSVHKPSLFWKNGPKVLLIHEQTM